MEGCGLARSVLCSVCRTSCPVFVSQLEAAVVNGIIMIMMGIYDRDTVHVCAGISKNET